MSQEVERPIEGRWEYVTMTLQGDVVDAANKAGKFGWEIIQLSEAPDGSIVGFCKRRPSRIQLATDLSAVPLSLARR